MALLIAILAVPFVAQPVAADGDLVVEGVRTDAYPRLTVRFTFSPTSGTAPADLSSRHVSLADAEQAQRSFDVYSIGRSADGRRATYEATWHGQGGREAGEFVRGTLAVAIPNRPESAADFSYLVPYVGRARPEPPPPPVLPLRQVALSAAPVGDRGFPTALAAILGGTAVLLIAGALAWQATVRARQDRLAVWVAGKTPLERRPSKRRNARPRLPWLVPIIQTIGQLGTRLLSQSQSERLRRNLLLAGRPSNYHYVEFMAIKLGLTLGLGLLGLWLTAGRAGPLNLLGITACLALLGFLLPGIWLGRAINARKYRLRKALPDALDLMTIGVSAGLAFDGALAEIVEKWDNDLSREFSVMLGELRMGAGRREALLGLADRTQVDEIQQMVAQLIQAEELGMSLTETLLTLANQMRIRRRQHAEELAHKAAIKMLVPLVFLIFPALFVVILGPAVPDMITFITKGVK